MGGSSGGGARTPTIMPNNLESHQKVKLIDIICSGEIYGFSEDTILQSIKLDDTPIQNKDGSANFGGIRVEYRDGSLGQDYMPGFASLDKSVSVATRVKKNEPITRTIVNPEITSLRVTAGVDALSHSTMEGDQYETNASMQIQLLKNNRIVSSKMFSVSGKGSRPFYQDVVFSELPSTPFEIRCVRDMEDSNSDLLRNDTYFYSYVESIDAKFRFPGTVVVGIEADSQQFGNRIPTRTYGILGSIVRIPSNYDPKTRTYSGLWDRLFKYGYTNNPAWVLYDLLTNELDGFGKKMKGYRIDIDELYALSKYCDELVNDGEGGKEPRFVCNAVILGNNATEILNNVCSTFRGRHFFHDGKLRIYYDRKSDAVAVYSDTPDIYNNTNVIDGLFDYSFIPIKSQYNTIEYQYIDKNNGYKTTVGQVSDDAHIKKHGIIKNSITVFGATKESYARRTALWNLVTAQTENEFVTFKVGAQGIKHAIYDIFQVADNDYAGTGLGGRITKVDGDIITLDRDVDNPKTFLIMNSKAQTVSYSVKKEFGKNQYQLDKAVDGKDYGAFNAVLENVEPRLFRCLNIVEDTEEGIYTIVAVKHNPQKEDIVDNGAEYDDPNHSLINTIPHIVNAHVSMEGREIILKWDSLEVAGSENRYRIQLYKDRELYQTYHTEETFFVLTKLPQGEYIAKIRAVNKNGQYSEEIQIAFSTTYIIDGLRAKGVVFGIELSWHLPALITSDAVTEIWYSEEDDRSKATKLAITTYPQNHYTLSGLSVSDAYYFWFRLVDSEGNQGEFTKSILGKPSAEADDILGYLDGKISDKEISKDLQDQFDKNIDDKIGDIKLEIDSELDGIGIDLIGINSELDNIKTDITGIDSEIDGIKNDIISIDSEIESVKSDTEKALQDAEQNAKDILEKSEIIDLVSKKQGQAEANWLLAQMANVSAQKSQFSRSEVLTAQVADNISKIENVESVIVTDREATAFRFGQLSSRVGDAESKITNVEETLSNEIKAEASKREALEAVFDLSKASQQLQLMTQSSADKSLSSRLFSMSTSTANAHAKYDELQEVVATNEEARVTSEQKLQAEINSSKTEIGRIDQVMTSEFASQATSISNLSSELDGAKADIKQAEQTIVDNEKAQAKKNDEFNAQFDENEAKQQLSILTESTSTHSLSQRYMILSAQTANSSAKIEDLQKVFADSEIAWGVVESRLQSQLDDSKSEISRIDKVSTEREKAQSIVNESLSSELGTAKSDIEETKETIATNESAQTKRNESFDSKFDENEAQQQLSILTESTSSRSLSQRYLILSAQTANSSAKLENLEKVFADSETAWAITESRLQAQIDSSKSEISRIDKVIVDNEKAQSATNQKLESELDEANAKIEEAQETIASNELAQAQKNQEIDTEFGENKATQQLQLMSQSTAEMSLSQRFFTLSAQTANSAARLDQLQKVFADSETAWALTEQRLQSQIDNSKSEIQRVEKTSNERNSALTEQIESAKSEIDGNSASITEIKSTQVEIDGKINSMWTLKVDANGAVGGIMLGSDGAESLFKVAADTFVVSTGDQSVNLFTIQQIEGKNIAAINGDLIAKGTISSDMLVANIEIQAPAIKGGSIKAGHFEGGRIDIGNGNFQVDENGNLSAKSGKFEGTVYADKIEGDVVAYITVRQFTSAIGASYRFIIEAEPFDRVIKFSPFSAASWLRMHDDRSRGVNPSVIVRMNGSQVYTISEQYISMYTDNDYGNLTASPFRSSFWRTFRISEAQLTANGFADRVGISTTEFSVDIPKNIRAVFEISFTKSAGSPPSESYVVSEIPATIYRKSRVQVIYPAG